MANQFFFFARAQGKSIEMKRAHVILEERKKKKHTLPIASCSAGVTLTA